MARLHHNGHGQQQWCEGMVAVVTRWHGSNSNRNTVAQQQYSDSGGIGDSDRNSSGSRLIVTL